MCELHDTVYGKLISKTEDFLAFFCSAFIITISKYQLQIVHKK